MPAADRLSLDSVGLAMPDLSDISNKGFVNVVLDRAFAGSGGLKAPRRASAGSRPSNDDTYMFLNFTRLVDKALREYDASRALLIDHVNPPADGRFHVSGYVMAVDHMENCLNALHRANLLKVLLRGRGYGRAAPKLTTKQELRLRYLRNAYEHIEGRLQSTPPHGTVPKLEPRQPVALRLSNRHVVVAGVNLRYDEIVAHLRKMHTTVEVLRGAPTGAPGASFPNARLTTDRGLGPATGIVVSDYVVAISRLVVSH